MKLIFPWLARRRWYRVVAKVNRGEEPTPKEKKEFGARIFFASSGPGLCAECGGITRHEPDCLLIRMAP